MAGFLAGLLHPVSGLDHVLAMVAVGLWGAQLGAPAMWLLPVTFPLVMAFGGFMGLLGVPLPGVEIGIAASAVLLGAMVATESRPPLCAGRVAGGVFRHLPRPRPRHRTSAGTERAALQRRLRRCHRALHAIGIGIGLVHRFRAGRIALQAAGALVTLAGVIFLWRAL